MKNLTRSVENDTKVARSFKANALVRALLHHGILHGLGVLELEDRFPRNKYFEDWGQLMRLSGIDFSTCEAYGYTDADYCEETIKTSAVEIEERAAHIMRLEGEVRYLRAMLHEFLSDVSSLTEAGKRTPGKEEAIKWLLDRTIKALF